MRTALLLFVVFLASDSAPISAEPPITAKPGAFETLVNPACSHCVDEAKRRASELKANDRVLCWIRGYSDGGAIPLRFFLNAYRVISDSYGVFVYDPDGGYMRGFGPSFEFRFHGWRNGVMLMKHNDGTIYSCLTGVAIAGPKKGSRLTPVPTIESNWGDWLKHYPNAVAYRIFEKYRPQELPAKAHPDSVKSRGKIDPRLKAEVHVLGVWTGKTARAYPLSELAKGGFVKDTMNGESVVVLWDPDTHSGSAFRPVAHQPRKFKAPAPDERGVSKPDEGVPIPPGSPVVPSKAIQLRPSKPSSGGRFADVETGSLWDVAGRCVEGKLKGWTLEWVDSVQVKWFAWAAEYPTTTIYTEDKASCHDTNDANKKVKEVAGTAEFLRVLPKPFGVVKAVDPKKHTVTLLLDGEKMAKVWPVEPDAEMKVNGWWGRLEQFKPGDRVWVWLKLNRKKTPVSVIMLADETSEYDFHSSLRLKKDEKQKIPSDTIEVNRRKQKDWLRSKWINDGLPGTLTFHHVFSGELEMTLDHEAMRWGRSLKAGDVVHLTAQPPIKGVVKTVTPWRERTMIRLVVGELESSELKIGQRLGLKMTAPPTSLEESRYPCDIGRPRTKNERIEWFLASIYCCCPVNKDVCTGHFYTLASCNPNGCGMPNNMRKKLSGFIDKEMTDVQIFDALTKEFGGLLLKPHLKP